MIVLILFLLLLTGCGSDNYAGGGATSESTNGIVIFIVADTAGNPVPNCNVEIRSQSYLPSVSDRSRSYFATSDTVGVVKISALPEDSLTVVVENDSLGFRFDIYSDGKSEDSVGTVTILEPGTITGRVLRDSLNSNDRLFVKFQGTDYWVEAASDGKFSLELPAGNWPFTVTSEQSPNTAQEYPPVAIESNEKTETGYIYTAENVDHQKKAIDLTFSQNDIDTVLFEDIAVVEGAVIQQLDMSGYRLKSLLPMMGDCNILDLDVSDNEITAFPPAIGWGIPQMERLDLSNNLLTAIPTSLRTMKRLRFLDLRGNNLNYIPVDLEVLTPDTLLVEGNQLTGVSPEIEVWLDTYAEDNWRNLQVM